jgi:hypothetical protein
MQPDFFWAMNCNGIAFGKPFAIGVDNEENDGKAFTFSKGPLYTFVDTGGSYN